jgi:hypothetical protein
MLCGFFCLLLFLLYPFGLFVYDDIGISGSRRMGYWFMGLGLLFDQL